MSIPLVCVNGVVPPELTFAGLARDVTERPVLLHDLVGYREVLPPGYGVDAELHALADAVDGRAHLLGYSAGASVTLAFAAAYPDRVASLTLVALRGRDFAAPPQPSRGSPHRQSARIV